MEKLKYVESVVSFLMTKFSQKVKFDYNEDSDVFTVKHNIPDLLENLEFQKQIYENLFKNRVYNVHFEFDPIKRIFTYLDWEYTKKDNFYRAKKNIGESIKKDNYSFAA